MAFQSNANNETYAGKYFKLGRDLDMQNYKANGFYADVLVGADSTRTWTKMADGHYYAINGAYVYETSYNPATGGYDSYTFSEYDLADIYMGMEDVSYNVGDKIDFDVYVEGLTGRVEDVLILSGNTAYYSYWADYLKGNIEYDDDGNILSYDSFSGLNFYSDISSDMWSSDEAEAEGGWDTALSDGIYYRIDLSYKGLTYMHVTANYYNYQTISNFQGSFDGDGHTIDNSGLFGNINATSSNVTIKNLVVDNSYYTGNNNGDGLTNKISATGNYTITIDNVIVYKGTSSCKSGNITYVGSISAFASGKVTISNCKSVDVSKSSLTTPTTHIGGIVGELTDGAVVKYCTSNINIYSSGTSQSSHPNCIGGIVGNMDSQSSVLDCYSTATIKGAGLGNVIGGVVGWISYTNQVVSKSCAVKNNLFQGAISNATGKTNTIWLGGIVGRSFDSTAVISNNISNGSLTNDIRLGYIGGIISPDQSGTCSNNVYNTSKISNTNSTSINTHGVTSDANMKLRSTYASWEDFDSHWIMSSALNDGYPMLRAFVSIAKVTGFDGEGTSGSPYLIKTHQDLMGMASYYNDNPATESGCYWKLVNNLDMSRDAQNVITHFAPICYDKEFDGYFDGNNKTISGLLIDNQYSYVGLFGTIGASAYVKNVTVKGDIYWDEAYAVGGVAGRVMAGGYIQNCNFTGNIIGVLNNKSSTECSGVVGKYAINGAIDCSATYTELKYAKIGGTSASPTYTYYLYDWARITTNLYNKKVG